MDVPLTVDVTMPQGVFTRAMKGKIVKTYPKIKRMLEQVTSLTKLGRSVSEQIKCQINFLLRLAIYQFRMLLKCFSLKIGSHYHKVWYINLSIYIKYSFNFC